MGSAFSAVTALTPAADGRFGAEISDDWTINHKPNGGYLLAILGRAAVEVGAHPHVIAASATYLAAPDPGPAEVHAQVLRAGRSASQVRVTLAQADKACVEALITTSELDPVAEPYWSDPNPLPEIADRDACPRVPSRSPVGLPVPIMDQVDLRLDPSVTGFTRGEPSGRGELRGWLALPGDEPFDPVALLYAVDAFPPATFEVAATGWVPTLELTTYVRTLPAPGPVQVRLAAQLIEAQRVDEVCQVWDSRGRLVAQATQLAGIRLG
ncbi:MAG TPA: thioesterase family protein [Jatrophihabitans sp.]|jgi:acyl-coenzyme A thioesterase PaaI-like protein